MEKALQQEFSGCNPHPQTRKRDFALNYQHATLREINDFHLSSKSFFSFCFVRNPWDRLVSFYSHISQRSGAWVDHQKPSPMFSFDRMIEDLYFKKFHPQYNHCPYTFIGSCSDWVEGLSFIGKFENLQTDFNAICEKINISPRQLPHTNRSSRQHYSKYYNTNTKDIVSELCAKDIERFNYSFKQPKNS